MDKQRILEKIKKCLALGASQNPHEAAAAMRQARALMEKHQVSDGDLFMADVKESMARARAADRPAMWEAILAATVAEAYSCRIIFQPMFSPKKGKHVFIGEMAELASYTMSVLLRQALRDRTKYMQGDLKRCKKSIKTRRADHYCYAWVKSVRHMVDRFAKGNEISAATKAYMEEKYPSLDKMKSSDRLSGRNDRSYIDAVAGGAAGRDAQLHHGVKGSAQLMLGA
ncbi:MAG: DUF2786 domain-containing protein [Burkholderiales bacterium]|jgi:hypothetical protein|nr:DUF2786 domain-containing protein [Burkholderiales bacterium]